jgi:D-glycero-D-manno-heptose 1,7-bisphosphate phosphatase
MKTLNNKLVILDRDGVINYDSDDYIKSVDEWEAIPGSLEAIAKLNQADYKVVICTNQSGISRRLYDVDTLNAMHEKMFRQLARHGGEISAIFFCPHVDENNCSCRKPKTGMYKDIIERFSLQNELNGIPVVGDSLRDLIGAVQLGAEPHLVLTGKGIPTREKGGLPPYTAIHENLSAFVEHFLRVKQC